MDKMNSKKEIYIIFLWHAFFLAITMSMIDFNTVFPSLIFSLTSSKIIFGAIFSILFGVPLIFNVIFGHYLSSKKYKKKYLLIGINLRALSFLGMAFFTFTYANREPFLVIFSLFFWVFIFSFSGGFAGIVYTDLIGKFLKKGERGKLYAFKQFFSSVGFLIGGLIIAYAFNVSNISYPNNYALILFMGFVGLLIASGAFWLIKEPPSKVEQRESFFVFIKKIPSVLKADKSFSRFILVENLTSFSLMILPFYIVFAQEIFDEILLSFYLFAIIGGSIFSNIFWGMISKKFDSKRVVELCIILGALIPILSLLMGSLGPYHFSIIFVLVGFVRSGRVVGFDPYLLDIAPEGKRSCYLGIRGTLSILTILLPLLGGLFIELIGYSVTFGMVSIVMFLSFFLLRDKNVEKVNIDIK
jgi:MFS family permease